MRVLVTGANGMVGRRVVRELLDHGHRVAAVDLHPKRAFLASIGEQKLWSLSADLTDVGQVYQALTGFKAEAVVHMGSWSNAAMVTASRTYADNVRGAFNIFQASADLGIQRVVWGSSAQVYGFEECFPVYAPIDEMHPVKPLNSYALSKVASESAAEYFNERFGMEIVSFRIMAVREPDQLDAELERLEKHPETGKFLLWTRCDVRDCARACRLALEAPTVEPGAYNISGYLALEESAEVLLRRHGGSDVSFRRPLAAQESPLSCERARRVFNWEPEYPWSVSRRFPEENHPDEWD